MIKLLSGPKPRWNRARLAFALCALAVLTGCGQKGPLYLPEPAPEEEASAGR